MSTVAEHMGRVPVLERAGKLKRLNHGHNLKITEQRAAV